jgi:hypothetical protein
MSIYYFVAHHSLMPGSMVAPGDMRRELFSLRQPELAGRWPQALREMIYENVRQSFFPNRPSRLSSHSLLEKLDDAAEHVRRFEPHKVIHEVEAMPQADQFSADLIHVRKVNLDQNQPVMTVLWNAAKLYWEDHEERQVPELVTGSPIRILRQINM